MPDNMNPMANYYQALMRLVKIQAECTSGLNLRCTASRSSTILMGHLKAIQAMVSEAEEALNRMDIS